MTECSSNIPPLFKHQSDAIEKALNNNGNIFLAPHDPGVGKTRTALELFSRLRESRPGLRLLVVCPISLFEAAWHSDLDRFFPGKFSFLNAWRDGIEKLEEYDIVTMNYEFFQSEPKVRAMIPRFVGLDWMCVIDESSKIKNHAALTTKCLLGIRSLFRHRVCMSGTPAPNSYTEFWAQAEFVRPGIFGSSFNKFRNEFFHLERNGKTVNMQGVPITRAGMAEIFRTGAKYVLSEKKCAELMERMEPVMHVAKKEDCLDLPEQVDEIRFVQMGAKQRVAYNAMKRELIAEIQGRDVVAQVALTKILKLREITSGFAFADDGKIVETECPKIKILEELLDELGDRQAIIWCQFSWEIDKVKEFIFNRNEEAPSQLDSRTAFTRDDQIKWFISGKTKYLIAHPRSAAHGLTFVNCSHQIFFSMDYSWEAYEQARARTHRAGQKSTCVYYHILAQGTIDEQILEVLRRKGDMQELLFNLNG